jgi:hypothetical protein
MPRFAMPALAALALAALVLVARPSTEEAGGDRGAVDPALAGELRSGHARYRAFVQAETSSLRERRAAGDDAGARIHEGRLVPARLAGSSEPLAVVHAAASMLSLDARGVGRAGLLDLESHTQAAGLAFDAIRDALWATDKGLTGSIDERLANLRAEIDRHRRGEAFVSSGTLQTADRRRLSAALDALAWRLELAADRLSGEAAGS